MAIDNKKCKVIDSKLYSASKNKLPYVINKYIKVPAMLDDKILIRGS